MKKAAIIFLVIILMIGSFVLRTVWHSGAFKTITNTFSGSTLKVEGITGVEDLTIDQSTGIAFLSSDDRWASMLCKKPIKGSIYRLNLTDSLPQPVNLTNGFEQTDFHPHGISLFSNKDGGKFLFVVNHRIEKNFIEIFEYVNDSLKHLESISHDLIISPNDVVGVGERQFYFTNDHNEKASTWRYIKDLLTIGTGNVCYYDGQTVHETSAHGVKYANGVNVSLDGKKVYVAAASDLKVLIYDRDTESGLLTKSDEINTNTGVDNIEIDDQDNLWIGCHPQLLKFLSHAKNESAKSPAEIIRIRNLGEGKFEQETIYMNDGTEISASSVGAVYKNKLLIGPVFQRHFIIAERK